MKKHSIYFRILVLIAVIVSGCAQKTNQDQDDIAAINELFEQYADFVYASDPDGLMTLWEENGIRSEPGFASIIGKENIRSRFKEILGPFDHKITYLGEPIIEISGDVAYTYRTATIASTPKEGGESFAQDINVLTLLRKNSNDNWKIYIDCMNFHPTWSMDSIPSDITGENPYY